VPGLDLGVLERPGELLDRRDRQRTQHADRAHGLDVGVAHTHVSVEPPERGELAVAADAEYASASAARGVGPTRRCGTVGRIGASSASACVEPTRRPRRCTSRTTRRQSGRLVITKAFTKGAP
jgi:hypothetical protein